MSGPWQCARCGTLHDWLPETSPRYEERRLRLERCYDEKCPVTLRALLWRVFGKRAPVSGPQPGVWERLRSLRRGDVLLLSDNEYMRNEGWRP